MSLLIDAHRQFLEDAVRLDAFSRAIAEVVRPGHVVVDLGSGTGVLGLLACRAGASRVYSVDQTGMAAFAPMFFPGGNWSFDPYTSHMVQMYPYDFWQLTAGTLGALALVGCGVIWLVARRAAGAPR